MTRALFLTSGWLVCSLPAQTHYVTHPTPATRIEVPKGGVTVPMLDIGGRPVVEVYVNGKGPYRFIFDTGASATVISTELINDLGLSSAAGMSFFIRVDELRVAGARINGLSAARISMLGGLGGDNPPKGVLSASAFPGSLVRLDYPGRQVHIEEGQLPPADNRRIFEYDRDQTLPVVPIRIAGRETHVHLDSGSPFGLMLPNHFLKELKLTAEPVALRRARTNAGDFAVTGAGVDGAIELGDYTLDIPQVRFSDLRPGPEPGIGNIGYEVLRRFVVTLDSKNRRIGLVR
jgi:Aspartyl protease